jgi:hypothetical protein
MANITRGLTNNEQAMLKTVFGSGITYASVRVNNFKWFVFQPDDTAMTPNGQIYFPEKHYLPDFGLPSVSMSSRSWFVHEGAHLYQHYGLKWNVTMRGITDRNYDYTLDPKKTKLSDYGLEQMGDIAADYYRLKNGGSISKPYKLADYASLLPIK